MTLNEYQRKAEATAIYDEGHRTIYPALGLANEAGEVLGHVKRMLRDDDGILTTKRYNAILKELGDVLWYLAVLASDCDISLEEIAEANVAKLQDRAERGTLQGSGDER